MINVDKTLRRVNAGEPLELKLQGGNINVRKVSANKFRVTRMGSTGHRDLTFLGVKSFLRNLSDLATNNIGGSTEG
jgi:hypothetical protein